jgi:hypothetical protein
MLPPMLESQLGGFLEALLPPLNQNEQHHEEQNARYNSDQDNIIHLILRPVGLLTSGFT